MVGENLQEMCACSRLKRAALWLTVRDGFAMNAGRNAMKLVHDVYRTGTKPSRKINSIVPCGMPINS